MKEIIQQIINMILDLFKEKKPPVKLLNTWGKPLKGQFRISSPFGMRKHPITGEKKFHNGIDYVTPEGTPIYAVVTANKYEVKSQPKGAGNYVKMYYTDPNGNDYMIYYMHLKEGLKLTTPPERGQLIGTTGNTGASTGAHLHFEIRVKFYGKDAYQPIEPLQFIGG